LEDFLSFGGDLGIGAGEDAVEVFEDGDLRAETAPDGGHLQADVTRADHDEAFRDLFVGECFGARTDVFAVDLDALEVGRLAARRDDDVLSRQLDGFLFGVDDDAALARKAAVSLVVGDLVLLEKRAHALGVGVDDAVFPLEHGCKVEADVAKDNAVLVETVAGFVIELTRLEESLAGNAADADAGAAELGVLIDAGDVHSELGSPNGGHVAAGSTADDNQVVFGHSNFRGSQESEVRS
jgi:hypothetical protein